MRYDIPVEQAQARHDPAQELAYTHHLLSRALLSSFPEGVEERGSPADTPIASPQDEAPHRVPIDRLKLGNLYRHRIRRSLSRTVPKSGIDVVVGERQLVGSVSIESGLHVANLVLCTVVDEFETYWYQGGRDDYSSWSHHHPQKLRFVSLLPSRCARDTVVGDPPAF